MLVVGECVETGNNSVSMFIISQSVWEPVAEELISAIVHRASCYNGDYIFILQSPLVRGPVAKKEGEMFVGRYAVNIFHVTDIIIFQQVVLRLENKETLELGEEDDLHFFVRGEDNRTSTTHTLFVLSPSGFCPR